MTTVEFDAHDRARNEGPQQTPRLWLKRKGPTTGYVDGAWWPHSTDLVAELPDLLAVLSVRLGTVQRVYYNLDEWADAPRKQVIGGGIVRLGGYHRQPPHTVGVADIRGNNIVLLVVPADTDADSAHRVAMAAAANGDATSVESLLAAGQA
ncbi:DUF5994 family protein [Mycolicibacterium bacteremicum]|uniref:Uncharacterized protein n=1 Tax=Mycolicibacterium bacteremicum TaxID=564198 RepID=A0A1W9Z5B3_MYCBA|nr:DUF5994 family protein [Mycolicibacterium bacteremicum]MCV7433734.1 hypothetical protein [Mycolicibacterium bacteremicum]ORA07230.1 hypothetical protein BST17_01835 [Mycolicibacterium bacteremicum]